MATINIFVTLDTTGNPAVILKDSAGNSARSEGADDGDTIKWQKSDNDDDFDITELDPTGEGEAYGTATTAPGGSGQWLSAEYTPTSSDPDAQYPYTLTVETSDGTEYNTTKTSPDTDDDRPVIHNN